MSDKHAHVRMIKWDDIKPQLPLVVQWGGAVDHPIDIFITALGFEDRAVAIPQAIALGLAGTSASRSALGVICTYTTNSLDNERNRPLMKTALAAFCSSQVDLNGDSPQEVDSFLSEQILVRVQAASPIHVVFDISASSGNLILSVMHALIKHAEEISLTILYSEPERYFPQRDEFDLDPQQLVLKACATGDSNSPQEYGVEEVEINELYPGADGESRPEFVIAVPAFRTTRLVRCLQQISDQPLAAPDKHVFWILGEPPASDLKWRLDLQTRAVRNTLSGLVGFAPEDSLAPKLDSENHTACSTRDYRDILQRVLEEADRRLGYNLSVVHMGSKLQAVGIAFALHARSEIAVCYARPTHYNAHRYSEGVGPKWMLKFSTLDETVKQISQVGRLSFISKVETERTGLPKI